MFSLWFQNPLSALQNHLFQFLIIEFKVILHIQIQVLFQTIALNKTGKVLAKRIV